MTILEQMLTDKIQSITGDEKEIIFLALMHILVNIHTRSKLLVFCGVIIDLFCNICLNHQCFLFIINIISISWYHDPGTAV